MGIYFICASVCLDVKVSAIFVCEFVKEAVWCVCVFANVRVFVRMCECLSEIVSMRVPVSESVCVWCVYETACVRVYIRVSV